MAGGSGKCVVLINPPYEQIAPGFAYVKHITNRSPSLGLLQLAAELRAGGYGPVIVESDVLGLSEEEVARQAAGARPGYVGITLFTVGVASAGRVAERIKGALPGVPIIVGGPHISSMGLETLKRYGQFDYAIVGEGERALPMLLEKLERGLTVDEVPGLIWREGDALRANAPDERPVALDELAMPAWDLLPGFPGKYRLAAYDYPRGPVATIAASRGCPFHCRFCDGSTFGTKVRFYSPAKVVEMIRHLRERWGVRHVQFVDDLFLASRQRTKEFCELLMASGMRITWSCTARVDVVTEEMLKLMRNAGCWQISYGLESGSDAMLQKMGKHAEVKQGEQAVRWTRAAGIRVKGLFMLGFPGETTESIAQTKAMVMRLPISIMNVSKFTPYPGTPVYREIYGTSIHDDHWDMMNGMNFMRTSGELEVEELNQAYREVTESFYRQKRVAHSYMGASFRNPEHFHRMLRFLAGFAMSKVRGKLAVRCV